MAGFRNYAHSALKTVLDFVSIGVSPRANWKAPDEPTEELIAAMRSLDLPSHAHDAWVTYCVKLRDSILHNDPSDFLRWKFVRYAMFLTNHLFLLKELRYLRDLCDWESRWKPALQDPGVGNPVPFLFERTIAGNSIHLAYHVAQWEAWSRKKIDTRDTILEFGAGYGGMARLIRKLGFKGKYILYDLPQFSALQKFYLTCSNAATEVQFLNDVETLRSTVTAQAPENPLFIANISLSETPLETREPIENLVADWKHILITYQIRFRDVYNREYFTRWQTPNRICKHEEIAHIPHTWYLLASLGES